MGQVRVDPEGLKKIQAGMPSIGNAGPLRPRRRLGNILGVHGPREAKGKLVADGLVRLVDKALLEYQDARSQLVLFFPNGQLDNYHRAQDHLESCIQSLHKAIEYLVRMRGLGYKHEDGRLLVPRPTDLEVLRDPIRGKVRAFRDLLEHLDEDIIQGRYADTTKDVGPELHFDRACLADAELVYADLARWIGQIYWIAGPMSFVTVSVTQPPPSTPWDDNDA